MIVTEKVRLYPNAVMRKHLNNLFGYRRYCWNQGLALWNDMYNESLIMKNKKLRPNQYKVRNELVHNKQDWQYMLSARCLPLAITDLAEAWKRFFDKSQTNWGKPHFKSKKDIVQSFKTDRARIIDGHLRLDKPHTINNKDWFNIKMNGASSLTGKLKLTSVICKNGQYYACLSFERNIKTKPKTNNITAIDVNVGHFNYPHGQINTFPKKLKHLYQRIKIYQKQLAKKRTVNGKLATKSNNYVKTRAKMQRDYQKVTNIQHDLIQKFTAQLVNNNDKIVIEDLNVKAMQMSHVASKGLQRSLFGYFRQVLTYKCDWYGRKLILADRFYPSTQRCSQCGYIKTGDEKITLQGNKKHHTKHNEYICYHCGAILDRDENAVMNLLQLAK